jgi:hypothetical protein
MANLRIIYNNVADLATITASDTASGFAASNMQNAQKTSVHRSTSTQTVTYTLTWATAQSINSIALPATNLVAGDLITVQLYETSVNDAAGVIAELVDKQACTGRLMLLQNGNTTSTYTDFGYGGATKTSLWFTSTYLVRAMKITLTRATAGQAIDCARIICGKYWEPSRQVTKGIEVGTDDLSEVITTRSGNTYVDRKTISDTLSFSLDYINDVDRKTMLQLLRTWGKSGLVYVCIFPDNTNPEYTQAYSIYGRLQSNTLQYQYVGYYNTSIQLTSW